MCSSGFSLVNKGVLINETSKWNCWKYLKLCAYKCIYKSHIWILSTILRTFLSWKPQKKSWQQYSVQLNILKVILVNYLKYILSHKFINHINIIFILKFLHHKKKKILVFHWIKFWPWPLITTPRPWAPYLMTPSLSSLIGEK